MSRAPRRAARIEQRAAEGMPEGGWGKADLNLPALWYQAVALSGVAFPISGDQQPNKDATE